MRNKYDDMGETAANQLISEGKPLVKSVKEIAKENSLNDKQARRVAESANKMTFLNKFKEAEKDATFTFDLVNPDDVVDKSGNEQVKSADVNGSMEKSASINMSNDFNLTPRDHKSDDLFDDLRDITGKLNKKANERQSDLKEKSLLKKASVRADDFLSSKEAELHNLELEGHKFKKNITESAFDLLKEGYSVGDLSSVIEGTQGVSNKTKELASTVVKQAAKNRGAEIEEWKTAKDIDKSSSGDVVNQDNPISNKMKELDSWISRVKQANYEKEIAKKAQEEIRNKIDELS